MIPLSFLMMNRLESHAEAAPNDRAGSNQPDTSIYERGRLEIGLESIYTFAIVPNPFFAMVGLYNKESD